MAGAAGLAAAGVSTTAFAGGTAAPAPAPKWLPSASVGAGVGDATAGAQVDLFVPVWQDLDSLLFVRLGVGTQTRDHQIANFGLGYRTKIDSDWIVGLYGGLDASHTKYGHTFTQGSIGAELMSADWDARINGYLSTSDKARGVAGKYALYIHDTRIAILQGQEGAYSGFDGEVGYRVFSTDNTDVRLFAGGFSFSRNDAKGASGGNSFNFSTPDIAGPMGRAEVDVYDIDALGAQSRITVSGQISHDDVRGTSGYVGASLRIPLGAGFGAGGQALDELDRRMVDPVRRQDNVLSQWDYTKPEPVIIYNGSVSSQPTNTLYYVSDDTPGAGTYSDPTSLSDATGRSATNPFIVVTDFGGPVTGATIHAGQTVVGGGGTFSVRGADSHAVFSHDFAPGSGTPTLVPSTPGGNVLTVDGGNASIDGLNFAGNFGAAIYGHNVGNVDINNVTIDGSGGGVYGVEITQDVSKDMNLHVSNSTISGVSGDGVNVTTNVSDGGTSNQTIELTNSTISAGGTDVSATTSVSGGSTVNQSIVVDPTYLTGGDYGLLIDAFAYGSGASVYQNVAISDVHVSGTYYTGIGISGVGIAGGSVAQKINLTNVTVDGSYAPIAVSGLGVYGGSVTQQIDFTKVTATNSTNDENISVRGYAYSGGSVHQSGTWTDVTSNYSYDDGVEFGATAYDGSTVTQNFAITGLTLTSNEDTGLDIYAYADYGGSIAQRIDLSNATVTGSYYDENIAVRAFPDHGSWVYQSGTWTNITSNYSYDDGAEFGIFAQNGASAIQKFSISGLTAIGNYDGGLDIYAYATDFTGSYGTAIAAQYFTLDNAKVSGNYWDGMFFGTGAAGDYAAAYQSVIVSNSTMTGNYVYGIYAHTSAYSGGSAQQIVGLYKDTFTQNYGSGAGFQAYAGFGGLASQSVHIDNSTFAYNSNDGAFFRARAHYGGNVEQNANIYGSSFDHNAGAGLYFTADAKGYRSGYNLYYSQITQHLTASYDSFSHNGADGVHVYNAVVTLGALDQYLIFRGDQMDHNSNNGLFLYSHVADHSYMYQDAWTYRSSFNFNYTGITMFSYVTGASTVTQRAEIYGYLLSTTANYNHRRGIVIAGVAANGSRLHTYEAIAGVDASHNGYNSPYGGAGIVTITASYPTGLTVDVFAAHNDSLGYETMGIRNVAIGQGTYQYNTIGDNLLTSDYFGIRGEATYSSYQYFDISSHPNTFYSNTFSTSFYRQAGSTQVVH